MDRQAARVADIGDVIEELKRIDDAPAGLLSARQLKTDEPAIAQEAHDRERETRHQAQEPKQGDPHGRT